MRTLLNRIAATLIVMICTPLMSSAWAQGHYPSRPLRLIVPFGAGSGLDVVGRSFAECLSEQMKVPVVVENREGAGGTIGTVAVARAASDGYTIVLTAHAPFGVAPFLQAGTTYDPIADFAPITKVALIPMLLVSSNSAPFKNFQEMVALAKANPGKLDYASSGVGTPSQLSVEMIKHELGLDIIAVPYKSTGQAMTDTIGGQVPLYMPSFPAALPHLKSGRVRGLAIGSPKRSSMMPDIPTLAEVLKKPGVDASVWYGFLAPKGTPPEVINRLHGEIAKAAQTPHVTEMLSKLGAESALLGPAEFAVQIKGDTERSRILLQILGIKPQ
jgi:tripartite-type tricarboxylate transporter receptor subunit TctC